MSKWKLIKVTKYHRKNGQPVKGYSYQRVVQSKRKARKIKLPPKDERPVFCPKCGSMYIIRTDLDGSPVGWCPRCGDWVELNAIHPAVSQFSSKMEGAQPTIIYDEIPLGLKMGKGKRGCKHEWDYIQRQTRSGDEGMTTWSICKKCGKVVKGYVPIK